jgi:hypothetical protein
MGEFEEVARTAGVFRDIRSHRLLWKPAPPALAGEPASPPEENAVLINADGKVSRAVSLAQTNVRRMVMIATTGVAPWWTDGSMAALLSVWSKHCSVAVLQMLPMHIWSRVRTGETCAPLVLVALKDVVVAHAQVEEITLRDTGRVMVVVLRTRSGNRRTDTSVEPYRFAGQTPVLSAWINTRSV